MSTKIDMITKGDRVEFIGHEFSFTNIMFDSVYTKVVVSTNTSDDFIVSVPVSIIDEGTNYKGIYFVSLCASPSPPSPYTGLKLVPFKQAFHSNAVGTLMTYAKCFDKDTGMYLFVPLSMITKAKWLEKNLPRRSLP